MFEVVFGDKIPRVYGYREAMILQQTSRGQANSAATDDGSISMGSAERVLKNDLGGAPQREIPPPP